MALIVGSSNHSFRTHMVITKNMTRNIVLKETSDDQLDPREMLKRGQKHMDDKSTDLYILTKLLLTDCSR